ncbi:hypothetical protein TNCV_3192111 [Trichonephila clavipes]|nr:hypothetical protein TNCV_3192111 [Trichonephila clavipes]
MKALEYSKHTLTPTQPQQLKHPPVGRLWHTYTTTYNSWACGLLNFHRLQNRIIQTCCSDSPSTACIEHGTSIDRIEYTTSVQEGWFFPLAKCLEKEDHAAIDLQYVNVPGIDVHIKGIMSDLKKRNHEEKYRNT